MEKLNLFRVSFSNNYFHQIVSKKMIAIIRNVYFVSLLFVPFFLLSFSSTILSHEENVKFFRSVRIHFDTNVCVFVQIYASVCAKVDRNFLFKYESKHSACVCVTERFACVRHKFFVFFFLLLFNAENRDGHFSLSVNAQHSKFAMQFIFASFFPFFVFLNKN